MPPTAIALSGGGHRASVFGLGVLLYLADAGQNRDVVSIASVSGGSITNAFLAQELDFAEATREELVEDVAAPLAGRIAMKGVPLRSAGMWLFVAAVVVVTLLLLVLPWFLSIPTWAKAAAVFAGIPLVGWLTWYRGDACWAAYRRALFSGPDGATRLSDLRRRVHHVICATELRTGNHVYFTPEFIYGYRLGRSDPGPTTLAKAVQASAAFPGGFPPVTLPLRSLDFSDLDFDKHPERETRRLLLADGGVYDNMADEWAHGFSRRVKRWPDLRRSCVEPQVLIVVNSSMRLPWIRFGRHLPIFKEVAALTREVDILYENTTAVRRRELITRFDEAARTGEGLGGAMIMIRHTPWFVAEFFADEAQREEWPERAARADAVVELFDEASRGEWRRLVRASCRVPTTLRALGVETTAGLLYHAYVVAMCNLHVVRGYPLLDMPGSGRFRTLAMGRSA